MNKISVILMGGGGHCLSVIDVIESTNLYKIEGIIDKHELIGSSLSGYGYIAKDEDLPEIVSKNVAFVITVGQLKSNSVRLKLFNLLDSLNADFATIISPTAYVSKYAEIGKGSVVMHKSFVNAGTVIGNNCIINTGALVEHSCKIGNHCHISTNAVVNGDVIIEDHCFIGSSAVIKNGVIIKNNSIIGAGSVVIRDTAPGDVLVGNPARKIK